MPSSETELSDAVTAFCKAFANGDLDTALSFLAEDCEYHNVPFKPLKGHAEIRRELDHFMGLLGNQILEIRNQVTQGNVVMNERVDRYPAPKGREPFELPVTGIFVFRNGKIAEWRDYFDTGQLNAGVGQNSAPPGA